MRFLLDPYKIQAINYKENNELAKQIDLKMAMRDELFVSLELLKKDSGR